MRISTCVLTLLIIDFMVEAQPFVPYEENHKRLVQSISFSPDGQVMYFTLPHQEYTKAKGLPMNDPTPRLAIYQARKINGAWGEPELIPFSGKYKDYEPSVSPAGDVMLFNSNRPKTGAVPLEKNNIWFSTNENGVWQEPQCLVNLNADELEESYPTISQSGKLIYVAEKIVNDQSQYAVYETQFTGTTTKPGNKIEAIDVPQGTGDPMISPDGSYLLFTKFKNDDWRNTCDLHISLRTDAGWGAPIAINEINSEGPDYAAALSPDTQWIYYRKNGRFVKLPFQPILMKYRSQP